MLHDPARQFRRDLHIQTEERWGPIPADERREWSRALLDHPPTVLGHLGYRANLQRWETDGIVLNTHWVNVARLWDERGLTALEWLVCREVLPAGVDDPWGDCPHDERVAWTEVFREAPPSVVDATVRHILDRLEAVAGITVVGPHIQCAMERRQAGQTPGEYLAQRATPSRE